MVGFAFGVGSCGGFCSLLRGWLDSLDLQSDTFEALPSSKLVGMTFARSLRNFPKDGRVRWNGSASLGPVNCAAVRAIGFLVPSRQCGILELRVSNE